MSSSGLVNSTCTLKKIIKSSISHKYYVIKYRPALTQRRKYNKLLKHIMSWTKKDAWFKPIAWRLLMTFPFFYCFIEGKSLVWHLVEKTVCLASECDARPWERVSAFTFVSP